MMKNGRAPRPVVTQVSQPYRKTLKDSYSMRSSSCTSTMVVEEPTHTTARPRRNVLRNEGQAMLGTAFSQKQQPPAAPPAALAGAFGAVKDEVPSSSDMMP